MESLALSSYSPNVRRLLLTNSAPTPAEEDEIRQEIEAASIKLAVLQLQADAETVPSTSRRQTEQFISDHRILLSPIRRLPAEIVSEIFFAGARPLEVAGGSRLRASMAWTCSQVSSGWRAQALGRSALWADFWVQSDSKDPHVTQLLHEILRRSGSCCLNITYGSSESGDPTLVDAFISESKRWRIVKLSIPSWLLPRLQALKHSVPLLEDLILVRTSSEPDVTIVGEWLADAPRLYSLKISGFEFSMDRFIFPWSQLTTFESYSFMGCTLAAELDRLRRLTNLVEYMVAAHSRKRNGPTLHPQDSATLCQLQRLTIPDYGSFELFACLRTPQLKELEWNIGLFHTPISIAVPLLQNTLRLSPDTLSHITVTVEEHEAERGYGTLWKDLAAVLSEWQNPQWFLISLELALVQTFVAEFLWGFVLPAPNVVQARDVHLLPELAKLTILLVEIDEIDDETNQATALRGILTDLFATIRNILESRRQRPFALKISTMYFSRVLQDIMADHSRGIIRDYPNFSIEINI